MEYDASESEPKSIWEVLVQQVNEQSNLCDVTVKMGSWEKKFHRCVLGISPFFDHALNDTFREGLTGIIDMAIGTPATLETTIMFLYGKKPKLNDENIENILHIAEFLLMPNLKSACIAWLKTVSITRENCIKYLQLSSSYDFEIPRCTTYIEEHLPEMLLLPQTVTLTKDSVHLLFSDKRLSYVPMDDKVLFLLKWLDANPYTRRVHMKELLTNIDFGSVSNQCLQVCLDNLDVACHIQSEHMMTAGSNDQRVLIMRGDNYDGEFWCLDFERDQWFRVESSSLKKDTTDCSVKISGTFTKTNGSLVCSVRTYPEMSFVLLDLPKDACTKMSFTENADNGFSIKEPENMKIDGHFCIVSVNKQIKRRMQNVYEDSSYSDISLPSRQMLLLPLISPQEPFEQQMIENSLAIFHYITISTLYIGHIGDSNVEMSPLVSFKDDEVLKFAMGENAIAVILKSQTHVAFYDLNEGHLERKSQTTSYGDKIASIKGGFVIYNKKRSITFTRLQGACLSHKYQVKEIPFEQNNFKEMKYFICNQIIYRYYQKFNSEIFIFECTPFQALVSLETEKSIALKQLPLPKDAALCSRYTITKRCFEISLPKSILRCHVECPHCKMTKVESSRHTCYYFSDDSSSDDDYNADSHYDSDNDYV